MNDIGYLIYCGFCCRRAFSAEPSYKDFNVSFENTFVRLGRSIIWHDGKDFQLYCDLSEGIEALIFFFTRHIAFCNLRLFRCSSCGRNYLNTSDRKFCQSPECQHVHKLELNKQMRLKRKQNSYIHLLDNYYVYVRQLKRSLTHVRVDQSARSEFEAQQKKCADVVKSAILQYKSEQKPIDDDLLILVENNRDAMKAHCQTIRMRCFK